MDADLSGNAKEKHCFQNTLLSCGWHLSVSVSTREEEREREEERKREGEGLLSFNSL